MRSWFKDDPQRVEKYSYEVNDLHFDLSKNLIDDTTKQLLCELAQELGIEQRRDDMFSGKHLNTTEDRAVLHTALRRPVDEVGSLIAVSYTHLTLPTNREV